MKVCGFTIIKNAIKYDYPVMESIQSILPICDQFIVFVGKSEDDTLNLIKGIKSDKIKIVETIWDETVREGGKVLAIETNKAFDSIPKEFDWCFYLQSDEVVHEKDHEKIISVMKKYLHHIKVEGLLFNYVHFYGSYDYIGVSRRWYRNEIRIIRNNKCIRSFKDAQGFRMDGKKLKVKKIDASIYHYGWVKPPDKQMAKQQNFNKYWHSDEWVEKNIGNSNEYNYNRADLMQKFTGSHPGVMEKRISKFNRKLNFNPASFKPSLKIKLTYIIEKLTGYRIGEYKNYKTI